MAAMAAVASATEGAGAAAAVALLLHSANLQHRDQVVLRRVCAAVTATARRKTLVPVEGVTVAKTKTKRKTKTKTKTAGKTAASFIQVVR